MMRCGLPEGSRVRECPGCDETAYLWLAQLAPNRVQCQRCGAIFDPQTGAIEPGLDEKVGAHDDDDD